MEEAKHKEDILWDSIYIKPRKDKSNSYCQKADQWLSETGNINLEWGAVCWKEVGGLCVYKNILHIYCDSSKPTIVYICQNIY